jgi:hypothetical protein
MEVPMSKTVLIALAALAAGAIAVPLASAPAAAPASFKLVSRFDPRTMVNVDAHPKGRSAGDVYAFSASLSRDGKPDGRAEFVQTLVDDRYQGISIQGHLLLGDGALELQSAGLNRRPPGGAKPSGDADFAVVGGTGAYAGAHGFVHSVHTGRTTERLEVVLGG